MNECSGDVYDFFMFGAGLESTPLQVEYYFPSVFHGLGQKVGKDIFSPIRITKLLLFPMHSKTDNTHLAMVYKEIVFQGAPKNSLVLLRH